MGQINSTGQPVKMNKNAPPNVADFYGIGQGLGQGPQKSSSSSSQSSNPGQNAAGKLDE